MKKKYKIILTEHQENYISLLIKHHFFKWFKKNNYACTVIGEIPIDLSVFKSFVFMKILVKTKRICNQNHVDIYLLNKKQLNRIQNIKDFYGK